MDDKTYFNLYEDRYQRLHKQGIVDWIFDPKEIIDVYRYLDDFLVYVQCNPEKTSIIEFGCGQGQLATYFLTRGYKYVGTDISKSAIRDARKKLGIKGKNTFFVADVTDLYDLKDNSYDVVIDNKCFHMLITDEHRKKYLFEMKRILKKNGKAFFRDGYRSKEIKTKITNIQDFMKITHSDYITLNDYVAYISGKMHKVKLPRLPARANNEEGYRKEFIEAGFTIDYFKKRKMECIFYACVNKKV